MSRAIRVLAGLMAIFFAQDAAQAAARLVMAGREGAFYVSSDDGATWRRVPSGVTTYLNGLTSDNRGAFVAVGAKGVILRSADSGNTWTKIPSSVTDSLSAVAFDEVSDRMVAVGAQAVILRSDDQGRSWTRVPVDSDAELYGVATDGRGTWVAVGARGHVITSSDNAETFAVREPPTSRQLNDLVYASGRFVTAGVGGTVLSSGDGGATWKTTDTGSKQVFEGVAADGYGNVVAVGWRGSIYRSENGGETWSAVASGSTDRLFAATPFGERGFVIAGGRGVTLRSDDGGATWQVSPKKNGTKNLEAVARARLPNLAVTDLRLNEACEVMVTVKSTGPARVPPEAWDGRVSFVLTRPEAPATTCSLADLDPQKTLLVPGGRVTVKLPGVRMQPDSSEELKLALDPDRKLAQVTVADDVAAAKVSCKGGATP